MSMGMGIILWGMGTGEIMGSILEDRARSIGMKGIGSMVEHMGLARRSRSKEFMKGIFCMERNMGKASLSTWTDAFFKASFLIMKCKERVK